jgi:hypothetical protein
MTLSGVGFLRYPKIGAIVPGGWHYGVNNELKRF